MSTPITQATFARMHSEVIDNKPSPQPGQDDIQGQVASSRRLAASPPTARSWDHGIAGGVDFLSDGFAVGDGVQITMQTSHTHQLLSTINEHIHFTMPSGHVGDRMRWQIDAIYAAGHEPYAVVPGSPFTAEHIFTEDVTGIHEIFSIATLPAINSTTSTIYKVILTRVAATQDEYAGEIYVDFIDGHIKVDQPKGSTTEVVKE